MDRIEFYSPFLRKRLRSFMAFQSISQGGLRSTKTYCAFLHGFSLLKLHLIQGTFSHNFMPRLFCGRITLKIPRGKKES